MKTNPCILGAAGLLGIMATTAHAAPITGSAAHFRLVGAESSLIDTIASRHCWRHNGKRHCSAYDPPRVSRYRNGGSAYYEPRYRNGGSAYYEHDSSALPVGSQRWWDQMLRENRLNPGGGRN